MFNRPQGYNNVESALVGVQLPTGPSTPFGLKLSGISERKVKASWTMPADIQTPITGYCLQYRTLKGGDSNWKDLPGLTFEWQGFEVSACISGLRPDSQYMVRVCAVNSVGRSEFSLEATGKTNSIKW
jgi:hypothetical protein